MSDAVLHDSGPEVNQHTLIQEGEIYLYQAYDVAFQIDLVQAVKNLQQGIERPQLAKERRQPQWFGYDPPPVRITQSVESIQLAGFDSDTTVEVTLWDFGAVSVAFRLPMREGTSLSTLVKLSAELASTDLFEVSGARLVEKLVKQLGSALTKPYISTTVEDYVVFELRKLSSALSGEAFLRQHARTVAQLLIAEDAEDLSSEIVEEAISHRSSFTTADIVLINWRGALIYGRDNEDTRAVLEFAQAQHLELQILDEQLDQYLEDASQISKRWAFNTREDTSIVRQLSIDASLLFEAINNALKLVGEQYLATLYDLSARRLKLPVLHETIERKLAVLNSIYDKIVDRQTVRRQAIMELIIIVLIALELLRDLLKH